MRQHKHSILVTGIPLKRGNPDHFEHDDLTAATAYTPDDSVHAIHTPAPSLLRIHELMHSRHSSRIANECAYAGIIEPVRQVVEDCRIHMQHWPWQRGATPDLIQTEARAFLRKELREVNTACRKAKNPADAEWPAFATRIRNAAVEYGLGKDVRLLKLFNGDANKAKLAHQALRLLRDDRHIRTAAQLVQAAFFDPPEQEHENGRPVEVGETPIETEGGSQPYMEIINLPLVEWVPEATVGSRIATSGARLHRPALRRPVLPQRLFVRRAPVEPQGTILIDASGSMGDFEYIAERCRKAPFATVAYYAGESGNGWLYVYARGGMRARELVEPSYRGNAVDGPAMDWLLKQDGPRIIVTDREFCGAPDSHAQIVRLERLERAGLITVEEYHGS